MVKMDSQEALVHKDSPAALAKMGVKEAPVLMEKMVSPVVQAETVDLEVPDQMEFQVFP